MAHQQNCTRVLEWPIDLVEADAKLNVNDVVAELIEVRTLFSGSFFLLVLSFCVLCSKI